MDSRTSRHPVTPFPRRQPFLSRGGDRAAVAGKPTTTNMNLSKLEEALYKREIAELQKELRRGIEIISAALSRYCPGESPNHARIPIANPKEQADEFDKWMNSLRLSSVTYYAGYNLYPTPPNVEAAPEVVRRAVLNYAVKSFIDQYESIDEIRSMAEQAQYNSNQ